MTKTKYPLTDRCIALVNMEDMAAKNPLLSSFFEGLPISACETLTLIQKAIRFRTQRNCKTPTSPKSNSNSNSNNVRVKGVYYVLG